MSDFTDLPDLAAEELGGAVLLANDEFFAEKENLLKAHAAEWREALYTGRGKWMDGWETRRRREPGFDWCVVRLGLPGAIRGVVVDTAHFRGNYPAECSLEGAAIANILDLEAVSQAEWIEILPRSALKGDSENPFAISDGRRFTHLRFNIYPDGGVARLRVHGEALPDLRRLQRFGGLVDLAALENGGQSIVCSDMFFGSRNNLLLPGRPRNMSSGWETRRRRGPGHDWNIVRLGVPGVLRRIELDTTHFKGNAPGRCSIEVCDAAGASADALAANAGGAGREAGPGAAPIDWRTLLPETKLQPHTRHFFEEELRSVGRVSHLRLNVFPDGGVARLRAWGELAVAAPGAERLGRLNAMPVEQAVQTFLTFCGSQRWAQTMAARRPFEDSEALVRMGDRAFWKLPEPDWAEAFSAHPRIGDRQGSAWSREEQGGVRDADREKLAALNQQYFEKFGFVFLVCATGRGGAEMLAELQRRLGASRAQEIRTAAEEQAKILRLRIGKWLEEAG